MSASDKLFEWMIGLLLVGLLTFSCLVIYKVMFTEPGQARSQKVDSRWRGGPSDYSTSLDYMSLHPVCRDALREYVITDPKMVSYMCNMVGDIWVTDLLKEDKP